MPEEQDRTARKAAEVVNNMRTTVRTIAGDMINLSNYLAGGPRLTKQETQTIQLQIMAAQVAIEAYGVEIANVTERFIVRRQFQGQPQQQQRPMPPQQQVPAYMNPNTYVNHNNRRPEDVETGRYDDENYEIPPQRRRA